jgi:hypothetical protein
MERRHARHESAAVTFDHIDGQRRHLRRSIVWLAC